MKVTDNLNLNLPDFSNNANIEDLNKNSIIIDDEVNKLKVKLSNLEITGATKEEIEKLKKSIADLENAQLTINNKINNLSNNKVDKISGKGLSTNDFTNAHKRKVDVELPDAISKAGKVDMVNNIKPDENKNVNITGSDIPYKSDSDETILNKIDILNSELDTVKLSGIERNKELVANLNSKKVSATTNDNLKTNIAKVKDIKLGSGNAVASDVLQGKTFSSNQGTDLVGTMPNRGNLTININTKDFKDKNPGTHLISNVNKGYYTGGKINVIVDKNDMSNSPGNKIVQIGDMKEGYFGSVTSNQLITGVDLASKVGVTQGVSQNSTVVWHKFAIDDTVVFIAQKPIRNSISWSHLNQLNLIYGDKIIDIQGVKYKVRLIRGTYIDPARSEYDIRGSEWNKLLYPLLSEHKGRTEENLNNWNTNLSDSDLGAGAGLLGRSSWCQESTTTYPQNKINRGNRGIHETAYQNMGHTTDYYGWRPALEVVQ